MGSKASKPVETVTRKFPSRSPGSAVPPPPPPRSSPRSSPPKASFAKDDAIKADSLDPDFDADPQTSNPAFSQRLRQMGVVTPHPTLSHSSTVASPPPFPPNTNASTSHQPLNQQQQYPAYQPQNRTLSALEARAAIQLRARAQSEDPRAGRELVDAGTLKQALMMRARGAAAADIERRLRLKEGVVRRLGPEGVVGLVDAAAEGGGWMDRR
ncbi:hypothetical protein F5X96DRAFT_625875 [Biscogniauxia mediterranea]|nr:hypothetical protein F5X96DRAFT_625875 [Biscogniauxia mediterranea]